MPVVALAHGDEDARLRMIILYPLLVIAAGAIIWRERAEARNRGWPWFAVWSFTGATFTFSLLSGLSIGLSILPVAAALLIWVAHRAPGPEAIGFFEGMGASLLLVAILNPNHAEPWLAVGMIGSAGAALAYAVAARPAR